MIVRHTRCHHGHETTRKRHLQNMFQFHTPPVSMQKKVGGRCKNGGGAPRRESWHERQERRCIAHHVDVQGGGRCRKRDMVYHRTHRTAQCNRMFQVCNPTEQDTRSASTQPSGTTDPSRRHRFVHTQHYPALLWLEKKRTVSNIPQSTLI